MKTRDSAVDLNRQLDAYAAVAKLPERNPRSRWGKWTTYAAATGAALASASAASADIFYSGPVDVSGSQVSVRLGGRTAAGGYSGIGFRAVDSIFRHLVATTNGSGVRGQSFNLFNEIQLAEGDHAAFFGGGSFPKSFTSGAPISGTLRQFFVHYAGTAATHGGHFPTRPSFLGHGGVSAYGQPPNAPQGTHLFGFATYKAQGSNGPVPGSEVGWVRVKFDFDTNWPGSFEIIDYAYNTDGPIDAGQTSATPEPNYLPLMLLAGGAAGVLAWKRRRSQPAPDA